MKTEKNPDDIIYVLGGSGLGEESSMHKEEDKKNGWKTVSIILAAIIFAGIAVFAGRRLYFNFEYPKSRPDSEIISQLKYGMPGNPGVEYSEKEILGVNLKIYALSGLKAHFVDSLPRSMEKVYLITRNADYRTVDGHSRIIGDYAVDGHMVSRSTWRAGFMAVVDGNAQIGVSRSRKVLKHVLRHGGSFFRQMAIISSGVRCPSQYILKGKVSRCAYARDAEDNLYYIETGSPETLFGFADALIECGFVDAVYVTGGTQPSLFYRDSSGTAHGWYSDDKPHTMVLWTR